jgi:hypothetical protein
MKWNTSLMNFYRKEIAALFVKKGTRGLELIDQIGVKHSDFFLPG